MTITTTITTATPPGFGDPTGGWVVDLTMDSKTPKERAETTEKYLNAIDREVTVRRAMRFNQSQHDAEHRYLTAAEVLDAAEIRGCRVEYNLFELSILTIGGVEADSFEYAIGQADRYYKGYMDGVGLWNYIRAVALSNEAQVIADRTPRKPPTADQLADYQRRADAVMASLQGKGADRPAWRKSPASRRSTAQ